MHRLWRTESSVGQSAQLIRWPRPKLASSHEALAIGLELFPLAAHSRQGERTKLELVAETPEDGPLVVARTERARDVVRTLPLPLVTDQGVGLVAALELRQGLRVDPCPEQREIADVPVA